MSFSRDDLAAYAAQPQVQDPNFDPWAGKSSPPEPQVKAEASTDPVIAEDVPEPSDKGDIDGSTTETTAEPVAANDATPEGDKDPNLDDLDTDGVRPRSRAQERIEELVAERNALRKYGEYLLSQVDDLRKAPPKGAQQESRPAPTEMEDTAPTLESADYDPIKLNKMQNEWIQKQVDKQVKSAVEQIESRRNEGAIRQAFESRTAEFRKNAPDFDTVIANPALPQLAPEAARVIVRSDQGPDIVYHLAKNPDLATRISRMEPVSQAAAIGRLEEQIVRNTADSKNTQKEPSKTPKPASVTKAPPPPKPVSSGSAVVQRPGELMSMDEWVANERSKKIADQAAKKKLRLSMR